MLLQEDRKYLVKDMYNAANAAGIPLEDYDLEDSHDLDGDGNFWEPDGLVDHLQIIHSGMGQEAGGGSLGDKAVWSHRSASFVDLRWTRNWPTRILRLYSNA